MSSLAKGTAKWAAVLGVIAILGYYGTKSGILSKFVSSFSSPFFAAAQAGGSALGAVPTGLATGFLQQFGQLSQLVGDLGKAFGFNNAGNMPAQQSNQANPSQSNIMTSQQTLQTTLQSSYVPKSNMGTFSQTGDKSFTYTNPFGTQAFNPNVGLDKEGMIRTGSIGLSANTVAKQTALSAKYGIATFDVNGNISTFAGFGTGK